LRRLRNQPVNRVLAMTLTIGVYIVIKGKPIEIEPEIVNWQTGGVLKSTATLGLLKETRTESF